jgi:hypothetical protein
MDNATAAVNNRVLLEVMIITIHPVQKGTEKAVQRMGEV